MTSQVKSAIDAWRLAEERARDIEYLFECAFSDYAHNRIPSLPPELAALVAKSRQRSNALLTEALSLLKSEVH